MLRTVGIDLAAQARDTAACQIEWSGQGTCNVLWVREGTDCTDDALVAWMAQASAIGIDAPMGWPSALVDLLPEYMATGRWPVVPQFTDGRVWYDELRLRETDRAVHRLLLAERDVSVRLLSVSSDTIAVVAWRCARLIAMHGGRNGVAFDRTRRVGRSRSTRPPPWPRGASRTRATRPGPRLPVRRPRNAGWRSSPASNATAARG